FPAGTFCDGRFSRIPLNVLPSSFSVVFEKVEFRRDSVTVTYEKIWFDSAKRLVRRDYKMAGGNDPDPTTQIFDFNLEFFHKEGALIHYVGSRITRSVRCDVWVGIYADPDSARNFTIEWYFTKDNVVEGIGGNIQPASLFRIDIFQAVGEPPITRNVLQLDKESPPQEVFDVSQCFPSAFKARLLIYFSVVNNKSISSVSASYLKDLLHISLVNRALLPPLRISGVS
ncbi:hypothetical protein MAR_009417, partial [Mya arenaria]